MDRNLFVSTDAKCTDSVSSLGKDWLLTSKLLQYFASSGQSVSRLSNTNIQTQLLQAQFLHGVCHFCRKEKNAEKAKKLEISEIYSR
jgi:hypothetical protein